VAKESSDKIDLVRAAIFPIECQGITAEHLGVTDKDLEKYRSKANFGTIKKNWRGQLALFHTNHTDIRMTTKSDAEKNKKNPDNGVKRCEACQAWYPSLKSKGGSKGNGWAALKRNVEVLREAEASLKDYSDKLGEADRKELEAFIQSAQLKRKEMLEEHPEWGEKLVEAGLA